MATIAAVNQVGESVAKLLNDRRALLAATGRLGDLPAAVEITHISMSRMARDPEPTAGLTIMLYRIEPSEFQGTQRPVREPSRPSALGVDLLFMVTAWSGTSQEEQAMLGWAMLELYRYPLLDRSMLTGDGVWNEDETVQLVHERLGDDALFAVWYAMQRRYRLSTAYRARVVRLEDPDPATSWPPVVVKRIGYTDSVPLTVGASA